MDGVNPDGFEQESASRHFRKRVFWLRWWMGYPW